MSGELQVGDIVILDESYFDDYYDYYDYGADRIHELIKPMLIVRIPGLKSRIRIAYVLPIGETESFPVYIKYLKKIG
jgi:hypothetical protein